MNAISPSATTSIRRTRCRSSIDLDRPTGPSTGVEPTATRTVAVLEVAMVSPGRAPVRSTMLGGTWSAQTRQLVLGSLLPARSRLKPSSSRTGTPSSWALASFEPAFSPATR